MNELKFNKSYLDIEIIHNLNNNTKKIGVMVIISGEICLIL